MTQTNPFFVANPSAHWYDSAGEPVYTVLDKKGNERNTDVRDARKLSLSPSVTTVLKIMYNEQLENWKKLQVLECSLTLPRYTDEPEADWIKRVVADSKEYAIKTAREGTAWHDYVAKNLETILKEEQGQLPRESIAMREFPDLWFEQPPESEKLIFVDDWFKHNIKGEILEIEKSFCQIVFPTTKYGGRIDFITQEDDKIYVNDIKTKNSIPDKPIAIYADDLLQLSAYGYCARNLYRCNLLFKDIIIRNILISRNENRIEIKEYSEEEFQEGIDDFLSILQTFWRLKRL